MFWVHDATLLPLVDALPAAAKGLLRVGDDIDEPLADFAPLHQMNLLLDTHAFICFMKSSERITKRESIEGAGGVRVLRIASAWERAIEASRSARTRLGTR